MKSGSVVQVCILAAQLSLLMGWVVQANATTYYVATNGNNSGSGSINQPWQTISYAVGASSSVSAGDTIQVRAGNYPETVSVGKAGAPGSVIVLMNYPGENVTLDPGRIKIEDGDDYWKISGLKIKHSNDNGLKVSGSHGQPGYLTISNCEFTANNTNGIVLSGPDFGGVTIEDCLIDSNGMVSEGTGIIMYGLVGVVWIHRNQILYNEHKGISHASEGDWAADSSVIDSNIIIQSNHSGIDWWGDNSYITHNYLSGNGQRTLEGPYVWGDKGLAIDNHASGNLIAFNVIKSSGRWELSARGTNNYYYNNTFVKDFYYDQGSPQAADITFFSSSGVGNEFKNNIIVNLLSEDYHQYAIVAETDQNYSGQFWSHNCYWSLYANPPPIEDKVFKINGGSSGVYFMLDELQLTYPDQEIGSIYYDPLFVNYEDSVFTLQPGSPCIDAGIDVGFPYLGDAPDMGAFEYAEGNSPPWINPPVPNMTTDEDEVFTYDLTPHEHDLEQTAAQLVWSLSGLDPQLATGSINTSTDVLTITPAAEQSGSDNFTLMLSDGQGGQVSQTVTLTVVSTNDPPWIDPPLYDFITQEDVQFSYDLTPHEHDIEQSGSQLTWSIGGLNPSFATGSVGPISDLLTITPVLNQNGSDDLTLFLSDGAGGLDSQSVTLTITPVNDPPVISPVVPAGSMLEDIAYNLDLTPYETDLEDSGTTLYWTASGANTQLINVTVEPLTDVLSVTPAPNANGSDTLLLVLHDSGGLTDSQNWMLTIAAVNDTPWIAPPIPDQVIEGYQPIALSLLNYGHDVEDPPTNLNWAISGINPNLFSATYNPLTKVLTIIPVVGAVGSDQVTLTVSDPEEASTGQNVLLNLVGGAPPVGPDIADLEDFWQPIGFNPQPVDLRSFVTCGTDPFEDLIFTSSVWDPTAPGGSGPSDLIVSIEDGILTIQAPTSVWEGTGMVAVRVEDSYSLWDEDTLQITYSELQAGSNFPSPDLFETWYIIEMDQVVHADTFLVHVGDFSLSPEFASFQTRGGQYTSWSDAPGSEAFTFPLIVNAENLLELRIRYKDGHCGPAQRISIIEDSTPPTAPMGLSVRQEAAQEPVTGKGDD